MSAEPVLDVQDLQVDYLLDSGPLRAVAGVSFQIRRGEIFGLVGESGSGKSTLAHALLRLAAPPAVISGGRVRLLGQDLLSLDPAGLRAVRGRQLALVPQSGMNALNPLLRVGEQIADGILAHAHPGQGAAGGGGRSTDRRGVMAEVQAALALVGLEPEHARRYPHELSGGMRQRAVIASALALRPQLVILDESTAALDMVLQSALLDRLMALQAELGFAVLFISHDLPLTLSRCGRVGVLYAGRLVEIGDAASLARAPLHPYTQGLMRCFVDPHARRPLDLEGIAGTPPNPRRPPSGCAFHPRCPLAFERCPRERPLLLPPRPDARATATASALSAASSGSATATALSSGSATATALSAASSGSATATALSSGSASAEVACFLIS